MELPPHEKAALQLEEELEVLQEKFENGELAAFGPHQDSILAELHSIRQAQSRLALRQANMLGEIMKVHLNSENSSSKRANQDDQSEEEDFFLPSEFSEAAREKEAELDVLTDLLHNLCESVERVNSKMKDLPT